MAKAITPLVLDVVEKNFVRAIVAKQYDYGAREIKIRLTNKGIPINVATNCVVTINAFRAYDEMTQAAAGYVNNDGTVSVPVTGWMLTHEGQVICDVSVFDAAESKLSTLNFVVEVEKANYVGGDITEDENYDVLISALGDVAEAKRDCENAATEARAAVAAIPEFIAKNVSYTDTGNELKANNVQDAIKAVAGRLEALEAEAATTTWDKVQKAVRAGLAPELYPIGTQLTVSHSKYGNIVFDVVAHDQHKSAADENAHTMTLLAHSVIGQMQADAPEAFYYADKELSAGTYSFIVPTTYGSWAAGTYQFTLDSKLPAGGQLGLSGDNTVALTELDVIAFSSRTETVPVGYKITAGSGGTNLGSFGVELNQTNRIAFGSNNYKNSAIRQFLNSANDAGDVWKPQTKFDRPPAWKTTLDGFVKGLDVNFSAVVGNVILPCNANNVYETPDSTTTMGQKYTVADRFYLASQNEIFGSGGVDDSVLFPYYKDATSVSRRKYHNNAATKWWLRSPNPASTTSLQVVSEYGESQSQHAGLERGCVPCCTIV